MIKSRCCRILGVLALTLLAFALPAAAEDPAIPMSTETSLSEALPCGGPVVEPVEAEPTFFEDAASMLPEAQPERVELAGTTTCNAWVNYGCCLNNLRQRRLCNYRNGTINEWYYETRCTTAACIS